ncbi:uncharacterized protein LOC110737504 [Chenopodium quinoa]|uniref:uncharacterized protein LOC110737504 n=1 Tax=Chenopodium quinoa TaxID=63459 RepID=UPI000B7739DE|nr:uncharacterized protein LOC110737504 [Chenopodium quinoa]
MDPNQDVPYPPGFFAAPVAENAKHCFDYNKNPEQKMNFNDYVYFRSRSGNQTLHVLEWDILRKIVAKPKEEQHRMDKLMIVNEAGEIFSAHLPNIVDVVGKPEVQATIRELEKEDVVKYEGTTKVIPKTSGPIYYLGEAGFSTEFGSYTEINYGFIKDDLTSCYQAVRICTELEADKKKLDIEAAVVLWNGRRITRPSFVNYFEDIVATHKPILMIVTEVGATSTNLERILAKLGTIMSWRFDSGEGLLGGTVVFWDPHRVDSIMLIADSDEIDLRVVGSVNAIQE